MDKATGDDPRSRLLAYFERLAKRAAAEGHYRGCGLSNATVEYPHAGHPAREVAEAHKPDLRQRLAAMAAELGAARPAERGDEPARAAVREGGGTSQEHPGAAQK